MANNPRDYIEIVRDDEYRENIVYIVRELCSGLDEKMLRKMTKEI